jgi:hypothetical protein
MTTKAAEKIIEALTQLMEGFAELQESVEEEFGAEAEEEEEEDENEVSEEMDAAIVTEMRATIEFVLESEEHSTEEFAALISTMTDALEEIDPKVFLEATDEDPEEKVAIDDDDDIDLDDDEDLEELEEEDEDDEDDDY